MSTYPTDKGLPQPEVSNFHKATPEQLAQEVINLRKYVGGLLLAVRELEQRLSDLTGETPARVIDLERDTVALKIRMERLEGKVNSK